MKTVDQQSERPAFGTVLRVKRLAAGFTQDHLASRVAAARASIKPKVRTMEPLLKMPGRKRAQLPRLEGAFFGRERDMRAVAASVAGGGCTTLWGTGGVGKTRLAIEATAFVENRFDRIALVGLACEHVLAGAARAVGALAADDARRSLRANGASSNARRSSMARSASVEAYRRRGRGELSMGRTRRATHLQKIHPHDHR